MLGQNYAGAISRTVGVIVAFADAIETIAWCHHPRIGRGALQILAKIFKRRRVFWWERREVVDGLIDPGGQAGGSYVVAEDAPIDDLREKGGLRDQFTHQV